jgi:hypothetical protein
MTRRWYLLTLIPLALLFALTFVDTVRAQPELTFAWNESAFTAIVTRLSGAGPVRQGFYWDFAFIAVFTLIVPAVLYLDHSWWWQAPVAAAALDVAENLLCLYLLENPAPDFWFKVLAVMAAVKLVAYGLTFMVTACRGLPVLHRERGRPEQVTGSAVD